MCDVFDDVDVVAPAYPTATKRSPANTGLHIEGKEA